MKKKKLLIVLPIVVIALAIIGSLAISGTTYTWEKTFEVTGPEIECEIEISDCRVAGFPVKVWVMLKLENGCGRCWHEWKEDWQHPCEDKLEDKCEDDCIDDGWVVTHCCKFNGTYSVDLCWWNTTQEDWQHMMYLQEESNITLNCWKYVETYTFTPKIEGEYKIVVSFTTETEALIFSSED